MPVPYICGVGIGIYCFLHLLCLHRVVGAPLAGALPGGSYLLIMDSFVFLLEQGVCRCKDRSRPVPTGWPRHRNETFFTVGSLRSRINKKKSGNDLLSHQKAVPSALKGLTSVFGMGTGGSPSLLSPDYN